MSLTLTNIGLCMPGGFKFGSAVLERSLQLC